MARERVKLTEKQERILVQAQLMGLTTADMVRIGNRLRALEKEREAKADIDDVISGVIWTATIDGWVIHAPDGKVYTFTNRTQRKGYNWDNSYRVEYDIKVEKPGTRFQPRTAKKNDVYVSIDYPAKLLPGKNKELFCLMKRIKAGAWDNL